MLVKSFDELFIGYGGKLGFRQLDKIFSDIHKHSILPIFLSSIFLSNFLLSRFSLLIFDKARDKARDKVWGKARDKVWDNVSYTTWDKTWDSLVTPPDPRPLHSGSRRDAGEFYVIRQYPSDRRVRF